MPRTEARRLSAAIGFASVVAFAGEASAYCIATTCDKKRESCAEEDHCVIEGAPLHWATGCLSFGTQKDGSPFRHISYELADSIIRGAFSQWLAADCGGGRTPSFKVWDVGAPFGGIECNEPEFNAVSPNANVWMFRDDDWPYEDQNATLALTSTVFDKKTGALLDADVEINSFRRNLTTTSVADAVDQDLPSIVTHEAGHFLGLGHSQLSQATMYARYTAGDLTYRSLHADDQKGICALYPPDRDVPVCVGPAPPHGFSRYCSGGDDQIAKAGCSTRLPAGGGPSRNAAAAAGLLALGVMVVSRRKRSKTAR